MAFGICAMHLCGCLTMPKIIILKCAWTITVRKLHRTVNGCHHPQLMQLSFWGIVIDLLVIECPIYLIHFKEAVLAGNFAHCQLEFLDTQRVGNNYEIERFNILCMHMNCYAKRNCLNKIAEESRLHQLDTHNLKFQTIVN